MSLFRQVSLSEIYYTSDRAILSNIKFERSPIMNDIEKIKSYIDRTPIPNKVYYDMHAHEMVTLAKQKGPFDAIALAFSFGMAKGYRAAQKGAGAK